MCQFRYRLFLTFSQNQFAIFFRLTDVKEVYARNEFATLEITLVLKRNDPYYTLTWFVPIMVLTFLTPIGLILPGEFLNISDIFGLGVITI